MTRADRAAMKLAIQQYARLSVADAAQIRDKLASEDWESVGRFAAYGMQMRTLRLRPWEITPSWVDDLDAALAKPPGPHGERRAAEFVKRMRAAGISRFHPDPLAALAASGEGNEGLTKKTRRSFVMTRRGTGEQQEISPPYG
jgi:hypothetical protein